jgi:hypothetical protein
MAVNEKRYMYRGVLQIECVASIEETTILTHYRGAVRRSEHIHLNSAYLIAPRTESRGIKKNGEWSR